MNDFIPITIYNALHNVYFTIIFIIILAFLDYFLTIMNSKLLKIKYIEFFEFEQYELNPRMQKSVNEHKYNFRHSLFIILLIIPIFILHNIDIRGLFILQGMLYSLFFIIISRHIRNYIMYNVIAKNSNLLSGKIKMSYIYNIKHSVSEALGFLFIFFLLFIFEPSYFIFGFVLGPLILIFCHVIWVKKYNHRTKV